ncbi:MAG: adenosylcobinamide-phosphate synthase CbiB [Oscillospiraceae bacterium]|jgi:adenosylcobinamide-phosphate synthase|nr:adenosylcobinamide-phosphate synthase CbiB [Oscillospiraceae bacterium]
MAVAIALGFLLDFALGDPRRIPHPVVIIGKLITLLERFLRGILPKTPRGEFIGGAILWVLTCGLSFGVSAAILLLALRVGYWLWLALEAWFAYRLLAARSLKAQSMDVCRALEAGDLETARHKLSWIVGRDTEDLDEAAVARAAIETVAENTTDGVVSPLLCLALGGAPLCFLFKAASTLDSMVGYKNERYMFFGRFSARADDALNFIPARISGVLMVLAAWLIGMDGGGSARILRRDRRNHPSPNSAHTEAACAGALGIQLGGGARYSGVFKEKPTIGDDARQPTAGDIRRVNRLMYATAVIALALCCAARAAWEVLL